MKIQQQLLTVAERIGAYTIDNDEVRLQKTLLVSASLMFVVAGLLWGSVYFAFGESLAGAVPISFSALSLLNILTLNLTHSYPLFRFNQLSLILILPFFLQITLGGFVDSSAVILWSLICPLGSLLFGKRREAIGWFLAFLILLIIAGGIQPGLQLTNSLPDTLVLTLFVANIGTVSTITFVLLNYFVAQKEKFLGLLLIEQEKSEKLLLNVLPSEIATALKDSDETIAEAYDSVSILFTDIVGFTTLSNKLSPVEMVGILNELFSEFDSLVTHYDLEKIRTIGDSYMVVAGAPRRRSDHAQVLSRLALDIRSYVDEFHRTDERFNFRIGLGSGPVVAGVIGRQKFHFDVWGDAVNMASRMESTGLPGKIQITADTWELIKDEFICEPRGKVPVKGKGEMEVWFLKGAREENKVYKGDTTL